MQGLLRVVDERLVGDGTLGSFLAYIVIVTHHRKVPSSASLSWVPRGPLLARPLDWQKLDVGRNQREVL